MSYLRWQIEKGATKGLAWCFAAVLVISVALVAIGAVLAAIIVCVVLLFLVWAFSGFVIWAYNRTKKPEDRIQLTPEAREERRRLREEKQRAKQQGR